MWRLYGRKEGQDRLRGLRLAHNRRNARDFGALRWYTDVDEMLKEELDGVVIVGPTQMHCEVVEVSN